MTWIDFVTSVDFLFPLSLVALLLPILFGLRHRILVIMAFRNAMRRKRQSAMIAAGLMVGTAIIAGAQVAGDSMGYGIRKTALDAFEEIDETVFLDGYAYYPEFVVGALRDDPILAQRTDAIGANILWDVAATNPRSKQYEPSARIVGFDPGEDRIWGPFRHRGEAFDATDLGPQDAVMNAELAETLDTNLGDRIVVNYTLPQDPLLPTIQNYTGVVNVSLNPGPFPLPGAGPVDPAPWETRFRVEPSAVRVNILLGWFPSGPTQQDLDIELRSPTGATYRNWNGTTQNPDVPAFLFVNASVAKPLDAGEWTLRVSGKAAARTSFNGTIATFYAIYDLGVFEERARALQRQFPDFDLAELAEPPRHSAEFRITHFTSSGKGPNFELPNSLSLYVRLDTLQRLLEREGQINFLKVSNPGGKEEGAQRTDEVYPVLWERLNETKKAYPNDLSIQALRANNDKQFWLAEAERVGELFAVFLTFVGSFSIIAGLLLIINIFTMLAEERKVELGIARSVGLRRGHLVQLFTFEGVYYALPAAIAGAFLGLGLAAILIWGFNAFNPRGTFPPIPFRLEPESLLFAFAVGILLTVATVYLGARRVSRLNIVAAIRGLEESHTIRGLRSILATALLLGAGIAGTLAAANLNSFMWQLLGPTFLAIGIGLFLRFFARREHVYPPIALILLGYLTITLFTIQGPDTREADVLGPVRAVVMALCIVVAVVYTERIARLLGRLFAHIRALRPVALPAVSYPLHKKFRTGLTLAMFSVILLVVMLFSILGALFAPDIDKESGGYHIEATSGLTFDTLEARGSDANLLDAVERYDLLPYFVRYGGDMITVENRSTGQFGPPQNIILGMNAAFATNNRYPLLRRDAAYASDQAAYEAAARDPSLVIVAYQYSTDEEGRDDVHQVGDTLQLRAKGAVKDFRIIGIQEQFHIPGIFVARSVVASIFPNTDTMVLFRLRDATQDEAMAQRIEASYQDLGLDANSIRTRVLEENEGFRQIFTLIRLFLSLGLVVGILSLGIVTSRNVIERRQEIGMLRALGYLRRHIRRTFLMEMLTTVTLGILIGLAVAFLVSFAIWYGQLRELRLAYVVPWGEILVISLIAYTVTTLATLSPILRAARTPPAEALRYIE